MINNMVKKGFVVRNTHHIFLHFYYMGKKTEIRTRVSHGHEEIGQDNIHNMAEQIHLTAKDFLSFVSCDISEEQYIKTMKRNGFL